MERWDLRLQESCQSSPSCPSCRQLDLSRSLAGSERSYSQVQARPATRYTVSVSPPNISLVVETLAGPPLPPTIESVETAGPDSLRVQFSPACPLTGPTAFSLLTECLPSEACRHDNQPTTELTADTTFQVKSRR